MDAAMESKIVGILDEHKSMRIATLRPDGWPQTTAVGYANSGLILYFLCGKDSQKAANLAHDDRVSLAIDNDADQVMRIKGLSMAARATPVTDPIEADKAMKCLFSRYPPQEGVSFAIPAPSDVALYKLTPTVISVLDYTLGFAHTDLATCDAC